MFSKFRGRVPSHTTVVAYLALFLVLTGGTAFALGGSNTVFSDDITNDEVRSADVRNDSLAGGGLVGGDIRPNSLTGSDINERSLSTSPMWAHIAMYANEAVVTRSSGGVSVTRTATGSHRVVFSRDISMCGYLATLGGGVQSVTNGDDVQAFRDGTNPKAVGVQTRATALCATRTSPWPSSASGLLGRRRSGAAGATEWGRTSRRPNRRVWVPSAVEAPRQRRLDAPIAGALRLVLEGRN